VATLPGLLGKCNAKRASGLVRGISVNAPPTALVYLNICVVVRTVRKHFFIKGKDNVWGMSVLGQKNCFDPKLTQIWNFEDSSKLCEFILYGYL